MACESLEGAATFSEEWIVGLYQYICVSSFPKDALSDVPDATSAKTLAEVLRIPFLPLFTRVRGETVRKGSEARAVKPYGPPKRYFSAHFGLRIRHKSTVRALLIDFFGQSRKVNSQKFICRMLDKITQYPSSMP